MMILMASQLLLITPAALLSQKVLDPSPYQFQAEGGMGEAEAGGGIGETVRFDWVAESPRVL